jgi:hypothetical protein
MAKQSISELAAFNSLDPDSIYKPGSMTFFYIPQTGVLHAQPYPTNHRDMLSDEDDPTVFFDVYPELKRARVTDQQRASLSSRGQALQKSQALLGRIGAYDTSICIIFWTNPSPQVFGGFLTKLFDKFKQFRDIQDKVVVIAPGQGAKSLTDMIGGAPAKRAVATKKPAAPRKKKVAPTAAVETPPPVETPSVLTPTRGYTDEELEMYKRLHTSTGADKKAMMKQLGVGGGGSAIQHPWKAALQKAGLPGGGPGQKWWAHTSEGFTFRDWIEFQDAIS